MKTLLVPTDFSDPSQNAINYAVELAKVLNTRLVLFNAYTLGIRAEEAMVGPVTMADAEQISSRDLMALEEKIKLSGFTGKIISVSQAGEANDAIKDVADTYEADMIIMGITGKAGFIKEKIIGSTTLDIAREMTIPLLIVPAETRYSKVEKISFAIDLFNMQGSNGVIAAKKMAEALKAKLEIVNVERPSVEDPPIRIRNYNFMQSLLENTEYKLTVLTNDDSHEALKDHYMSSDTNWVLLNPTKQNFIQALFHKSMTKTLAFHVKKPMLIVH